MRYPKIILILNVVLLSGCSTLYPEESGYQVYYLESRVPGNCIRLGEVKAEADSILNIQAARTEAREALFKKATELYQGNAVYLSQVADHYVSATNSAYAEGVVYDCPKE
mgnify:CR=1 FL=1